MLQQVNTLQCNACRKIFSRESSLKWHLLTVHMGVRASRCFLCGRAFTQSGNMRSHQQGVHFFLPAGRKEQRRPQPPVKLVITRADGIYTCRPARPTPLSPAISSATSLLLMALVTGRYPGNPTVWRSPCGNHS